MSKQYFAHIPCTDLAQKKGELFRYNKALRLFMQNPDKRSMTAK